jgi:uncharacterized membrane protein YheB (UPF0754 family)
LPAWLSDSAFWQNASIPVVAGLVGWFTNWVAIEMTFRPLAAWGWPPFFGWHGIIPSKAGRMAEIFVDSTMIKLGTLPELFERMEPQKIAGQILKVVKPRLRRMTDELMLEQDPGLWRATPDLIKERIYANLEAELPRRIEALLAEASGRIEELVDFKQMVVGRLRDDPALLNRIFIESGRAEFHFLVRSGLYFGFLFGLLQLALWLFYPAWWTLPVAGAIVGYATNWLALNIVFRPLHPRRVGPFVLQGIFLKRQKEVAATWCHIVAGEIVSVRAIIQAMLYGPKKENTEELIRRHLEPIAWQAGAPFEAGIEMAVGRDRMQAIAALVGTRSLAIATLPFEDWQFNRDRSELVERLLRERMEAMAPEDFQGLLRPCFQEDELKLILVGAVLGLLAGWAQAVFVFGF